MNSDEYALTPEPEPPPIILSAKDQEMVQKFADAILAVPGLLDWLLSDRSV